MRSQDDVAFQSQQFASEVSGRRNQIAQHHAGLNMQMGQVSAQYIEQMREQQRHQAEMAGDAVNLGQDQLELQQATEELAWARQLRTDRMLANALKQSDAQTALMVAQSKEQQMKLGGGDVPGVTSDDRLYALANGVGMEFNDLEGSFGFSKDKASPQMQEWARGILQGRQSMNQSRFANRQARQPGKYDEVETLAKSIDALSMSAPELAAELESVVRKSLGLTKGGGGVTPPSATPEGGAAKLRTPHIAGFGAKNTSKAIDFLSQPAELEKIRKALLRQVPEDKRKTYNPSDEEVLEKALNILRQPGDPRRSSMIDYFKKMGMLDESELLNEQHAEKARDGVTNLDASRFMPR